MEIQYTATAHASGGGRNGHVHSDDDRFNLETRTPKEMGGSGEGTNPEQLFGMGYATCFLGSLHRSGKGLGLNTADAEISSSVGIGAVASGGFGLAVELVIYAPNVPADRFDELIEATDQTCAYSNATRGNIAVTLTRVV
ncbi:organic hydroperoxide resistance protein [Cryobacterium psychrophilum]|uniref:Organic hydroperoxide resistance protein n=1 Tax=Cryobacterium psychrophilum TaxID=41988 RepID=A0A4Y8KI31_9MICO|nr:organic hydroperoxide resistance protein [Cryobacterium psychrophilum]TDW28420.1 Ohr subfamily peroxiredoxin [Cryobacterium psychrophilum]TFD75100.1 organic hydroperoxide resistance protein [Cryobacterium psychrophilum]